MRRRWPGVAFSPSVKALEARCLLSFADGNGAVVTSLVESADRTHLVATFDGPLNAATAQNASFYAVNALKAGVSPEIITKDGPSDPVVGAAYDAIAHRVTLTLARPLKAGATARVFISGKPGAGLVDANGVFFDGDDDDTPGGDFYAQVALGPKLKFTDANGSRATLRIVGPGQISLWRELNGDVDQVDLIGTAAGQSTLSGTVAPAPGSGGVVVLPSIVGGNTVTNALPPTFVSTPPPPAASPTPVVATAQNLPYTLQVTPVSIPSVPAIQSAVYARSGGLWLVFGGRTNGLHGFDNQMQDPNGTKNFPPEFQNNNIYVIDPSTGRTWTESWAATGLPASVTAPLSSTNTENIQKGDRLYVAGGYSIDPATNKFVTYDTLSALSVKGLIDAVMANGSFVGGVKQIHDAAFRATGGDMNLLGNRAYLVFGQDFEGGYNGNNADFSQIYTDEVRSFQIVDRGSKLAINAYQAQRDPINFRRRDGNLAVATVQPNGKKSITAFGGVFTIGTQTGYRQPVIIGPDGFAKVDTSYQQYFNQYSAPKIGLYNSRNRVMSTVFFGGIGLYDYNFATGQLTSDTGLPFNNDVTSLVRARDGSMQEYIMPSQLPVNVGNYPQNFYGAEAGFLASPGLKTVSEGVLKLNAIKGPTTIGYIYGGIVANQGNFGNSTASSMVFRVTLTPA